MEPSSALEEGGQRICPVTLEEMTLKDRAGVYFSSGALWRVSNVQRYSVSARTGEKQGKGVRRQFKPPLWCVTKVCEHSMGLAGALEVGKHRSCLATQIYVA